MIWLIIIGIIVAVCYFAVKFSNQANKLKEIAEQGDPQAQYDYAVKWCSGDEAVKWCQKAADNGHTEAEQKLPELKEKAIREKEKAEEKKMKATAIKYTSQYQIYLQVIDALKQNGYEIKEDPVKKDLARAFVNKGHEQHGMLFAVDYPKTSVLEVVTDGGITTGSYKDMKGVCDLVLNSRHRGKVYWPEDSLVGGFTSDMTVYRYDGNWIKILASVIG